MDAEWCVHAAPKLKHAFLALSFGNAAQDIAATGFSDPARPRRGEGTKLLCCADAKNTLTSTQQPIIRWEQADLLLAQQTALSQECSQCGLRRKSRRCDASPRLNRTPSLNWALLFSMHSSGFLKTPPKQNLATYRKVKCVPISFLMRYERKTDLSCATKHSGPFAYSTRPKRA